MKKLHRLLLPAFFLALPLPSAADPWKDESGHGKYHGRAYHEYKEEYWDGNCKVKRKMDKHGGYKEKRECQPPAQVYYQPAPVYVVPPPVVIEPGVRVNGVITLRH